MNAIPQKELTSLGYCFTNGKFMIDKKPVEAFYGFLVYGEKIKQ